MAKLTTNWSKISREDRGLRADHKDELKDWGGLERIEPSPLEELEPTTGLFVVPGTLDIQIKCGIVFRGLILQCKDENVEVTGS